MKRFFRLGIGLVLSLAPAASVQSGQLDWLCQNATSQDDWLYHEWFGWFCDDGGGWIYHYEHKAQYVSGTNPASFYLYDAEVGSWFWTGEGTYPYLYKFGRNPGWFWYYRGCAPGERWFMGMAGQGICPQQALNIPVAYVLVPAGSFSMGSPESERGRQHYPNETRHTVTLTRSFYISPTEIAFQQYRATWEHAGAFGYIDLGPGYTNLELDPYGLRPVAGVSWYDAVKWLNLRSEMTGRTPVYYSSPVSSSLSVVRTGMPDVYVDGSADGFRLPTEAEWEYACRAGTTTAFYTGPITYTASSPVDPNLNVAGWYGGNSGGGAKAVAGKQPNAWGLHDTHGNVWEWCWDWEATFTASPRTDPTGPAEGTMRVLRGGGFWGGAGYCRSASRYSLYPDLASIELGFRAVTTAGP